MEVQEVGIQVGPEDFCDWCNNSKGECNHTNSDMRPEQRQNHQYPNYRRNNLDEDDDDGYNGSSDNADDDNTNEDIKTLHISATSTRLERRKSPDKGIEVFKVHFFQYATVVIKQGSMMYLLTPII